MVSRADAPPGGRGSEKEWGGVGACCSGMLADEGGCTAPRLHLALKSEASHLPCVYTRSH